ncbi:MAG: hypothetical protein JXQ75_16660 [Phycisphaerae bacterium]|nr:hypothetical protein [Phycisphaerae bacterium]
MTVKMLLFLVISCGQVQPAGEEPDEFLGEAYIDGTCGFSIRPPKGWQLDARRVPEKHGVTLLRMASETGPNRVEEISLKQTSTTREVPMGEMLKELHHALELEFSNVEMLSQQVQTVAGRAGGVLAATYWREGAKWLRLEAVIELQRQQYYTLLYNGPVGERKKSEPLFHLVLGSLRLLEDQMSDAELKEAIEAGAALLSGIGAAELGRAVVRDEILRIDIDGKPAGFVRIQQAVGELKRWRGVRVQERGWMFEPGGVIRRHQANMFVSNDLQIEEWKTSITTMVPASGTTPACLDLMQEDGVRNQDVLLTSQLYHIHEGAVENPALKTPKAYISRALVRILPRLLGDLSKPGRLAFVEFDHLRTGLVIRTVESKGAGKLPGDETREEVYLIQQREGLAGRPSDWYVDKAGRVLMMRAGTLTMVPTKEEEMERLFGARVTEAQGEMARLERQYEEERRRVGPQRKG